jgi:hypothetical protein
MIKETLPTAILKMMKMMKLVKRRSAIKLPPLPIERQVNQMKMMMIHLSWRVVGVKLIQQSMIPFQPAHHKR